MSQALFFCLFGAFFTCKNLQIPHLIIKETCCSGGHPARLQGPEQDPCVLGERGGRPEPPLHLPGGGQGHGQRQAGREGRGGGQGAGRRHSTGARWGELVSSVNTGRPVYSVLCHTIMGGTNQTFSGPGGFRCLLS